MGTRFELLLCGEDAVFLRAAGEEALDEIERLEAQMSLYRPDSELCGLNARAGDEPVTVEPRFFRLLERAALLAAATDGAFDPTVAPLMRCWGLGPGRAPAALPDPDALAGARERVGMQHVALDADALTVRFLRPGMSLDLGAIGKGYAIEQAAALLRDAGITAALLHAGTSSVAAVGAPPGAEGWCVAIRHPTAPDRHLALARLRDRALSVSAPHARSFTLDGSNTPDPLRGCPGAKTAAHGAPDPTSRRYGHVLDPRTGCPVQGALLAAVITDSPIDGDALSTALLTLGAEGLPLLEQYDSHCRALVALLPEETAPPADDRDPRVLLLGEEAGEWIYPAPRPRLRSARSLRP